MSYYDNNWLIERIKHGGNRLYYNLFPAKNTVLILHKKHFANPAVVESVQALRARGYRWYEIDEEAATLTPVATAVNSAGNRWATARTHDEVKVLAGAAYCGIASAG